MCIVKGFHSHGYRTHIDSSKNSAPQESLEEKTCGTRSRRLSQRGERTARREAEVDCLVFA